MKNIMIGLLTLASVSATASEPMRLTISCFFKHQDGYVSKIVTSREKAFANNNGGGMDIFSHPQLTGYFKEDIWGMINVRNGNDDPSLATLVMSINKPERIEKKFSFVQISEEDQHMAAGNFTFTCSSKPISDENKQSSKYYELTEELLMPDSDRLALINVLREEHPNDVPDSMSFSEICTLYKSVNESNPYANYCDM